jgi:ribosomal protein S27AE
MMRVDTYVEPPGVRPDRYCPECGAVMMLARITPRFMVLPELQSYKCPRCGNVLTWEVDADSLAH